MTKRVEFRAPDGAVPEGTMSGEEFDSVCTFRVKDNGQICLVMLGDTKMPGYEEKTEHKPEYEAPVAPEESGAGGY